MKPLLKTHIASNRGPIEAVVHHKKRRKGNLTLFYDPSNMEAICWSCHLGTIQSEEVLGYDAIIGADGLPVYDKHLTTKSK